METKNILKKYIEEVLLENNIHIDFETQLIDEELLDSLSIAQLISFIEDQFDIIIDDFEFDISNFNNINSLNDLINRNIKNKNFV